jgi:hypothetical protein
MLEFRTECELQEIRLSQPITKYTEVNIVGNIVKY